MEPCPLRHGNNIEQPYRLEKGEIMLQWSHVLSDMVTISWSISTVNNIIASMEPCPLRHGNRICFDTVI